MLHFDQQQGSRYLFLHQILHLTLRIQLRIKSKNRFVLIFRPDSQSFWNCITRHWDVFPWPTVCGPVKMWGEQGYNHLMWQNKQDKEHCVPAGADKRRLVRKYHYQFNNVEQILYCRIKCNIPLNPYSDRLTVVTSSNTHYKPRTVTLHYWSPTLTDFS